MHDADAELEGFGEDFAAASAPGQPADFGVHLPSDSDEGSGSDLSDDAGDSDDSDDEDPPLAGFGDGLESAPASPTKGGSTFGGFDSLPVPAAAAAAAATSTESGDDSDSGDSDVSDV